jgi:hypothetical protein
MGDSSALDHDARTGCTIIIIVVLAIISGLYLYLRTNDANVFLDVSTQTQLISGRVIFEGTPVDTGIIHVTVSHAKTKHYLFGTTGKIDKEGQFNITAPSIFSEDDPSRPLRIRAEFRGSIGGPAKDVSKQVKDKSKPVSGEATRYLNWLPPLDTRILWGIAVGIAVLFLFQFILFTGGMGPSKARWLFILMYFFTFFSLALPIGLSVVVSQNPNMVGMMEKSPIGLVKAKAKGLAASQWLINIGGDVKDESASSASETKKPPVASSADQSTPAPTPAPAPGKDAGKNQDNQPPKTDRRGSSAAATGPEKSLMVVGGLAVPFYVVLLAMFGAGINMTLKVPEIQLEETYESPALRPEGRGVISKRWYEVTTYFPGSTNKLTSGPAIRQRLIQNYMYLLSAPFLAIAMYYLLQVVAEQVSEPVLVIMAFATGLVSKGVIEGIIGFAEKKLQPWLGGREAGVTAEAVNGAQVKAEAAAKTAEEARRAQAETEETARNAKTEAETKQAEAVQAAQEAQRDPALKAEAEAKERLALEAKAKQDEADAKARRAAQEAKAKQDEADAAASIWEREAKAQVSKAEEAKRTAQDAKAKQDEADAARKIEANAVNGAQVKAEAAAKTAEEARRAQAETEETARNAKTEAETKQAEAVQAAQEAEKNPTLKDKAEAAARAAQEAKAKQNEADAAAKTAAEAAKA